MGELLEDKINRHELYMTVCSYHVTYAFQSESILVYELSGCGFESRCSHELYITTEQPHTFKGSESTGKSITGLTFVRGLKNVHVKTKEFKLNKSRHKAIEILIELTQNNIKNQPKFKTKNSNWNNRQKH